MMITAVTGSPNRETWIEYYQQVHASSNAALDYSNTRVQGQTFGIAIEAAGPIGGKRCLDVGCGRGHFAVAMAAFQASEVVGIDIVADSIDGCRQRYPHVCWEVGSPDDDEFCQSLGLFDIIFAIEVLQYVDWRKTLQILLNQTNPGGRIVVVGPNKDNAIVQKSIARFSGNYAPANSAEIVAFLSDLLEVEWWSHCGLDFGQDQRIVPYVAAPWTTSVMKDFTPNRLVVVIQKRSPDGHPASA